MGRSLSEKNADKKIFKMLKKRGKNSHLVREEIKIPYSTIYAIAGINNRGGYGLSYKKVMLICDYLNCDPEDILEDEESIELTRRVFGEKKEK